MAVRRWLLVLLTWLSSTFAMAQHPALPRTLEEIGESSVVPDETWSCLSPAGSCFFVSLDYLLWWMKPVCLKPPILTAGSPLDAVPGAIGQPGTSVLVGETRYEFAGASGLRPKIGFFLTDDARLSVEVEAFALETVASHTGYIAGPNSPNTYLPYVAPDASHQALPFAAPGIVNGSVLSTGTSRLWGGEVNGVLLALFNDYERCRLQLSILGGFRYLELKDRITLRNSQTLAGNPNVGAFGEASMETLNQFYGVQLGQRLEYVWRRGSLGFYGKLAVGETNLGSDFRGTPLVGTPIFPGVIPGPIQVLPSNAGTQSVYRISLVPEIGTNLKIAITDRAIVNLGYSLIYMNRILCPGDLMDPRVNPTQLPFRGPVQGPLLPALGTIHTDYFAHGINAGLEFRF